MGFFLSIEHDKKNVFTKGFFSSHSYTYIYIYTIHGKVTIFNAKVASSCFLFFFSLDLLLEDEISASLRDLRRFLMRIPFILSLDFFHSGLGSVVQNLVFAFPLSSGAQKNSIQNFYLSMSLKASSL